MGEKGETTLELPPWRLGGLDRISVTDPTHARQVNAALPERINTAKQKPPGRFFTDADSDP